MFKKFIFLVLVVSTLISTVYATETDSTEVKVLIDNKTVQFTGETGFPLLDEKGYIMVPLRAVMEEYGCTVFWDAETGSAVVTKKGTVVSIPIGEKHIFVNGNISMMENVAFVEAGRTYVPAKPVLEAFGATVKEGHGVLEVSSPISDYFSNIYIDAQGDLWFEFHNGRKINAGRVTGEDGKRGSRGTSITDVQVNREGKVIVSLSNGQDIDAGEIPTSSTAYMGHETFADYEVGDKWYLLQPTGEFKVDVLIEDAPVSLEFDSIYYELTAKNDFEDEDAWEYENGYSTYTPYEVTVFISGQTDSTMSGKRVRVHFTDIYSEQKYAYTAKIDDSGRINIEHVQTSWTVPKYFFFEHVAIENK